MCRIDASEVKVVRNQKKSFSIEIDAFFIVIRGLSSLLLLFLLLILLLLPCNRLLLGHEDENLISMFHYYIDVFGPKLRQTNQQVNAKRILSARVLS